MSLELHRQCVFPALAVVGGVDVFCVYSQYIDDLMLLSKMIRAACDNEKTMGTYLGIGEVEDEK